MADERTINFDRITERVMDEMAKEAVRAALGDSWNGSDRDEARKAVRDAAARLLKEDAELRALLRDRLIEAIKNG